MMETFFSPKNPLLVLHVIADVNKVTQCRTDVTPPDKLLQASIIPLAEGKKVGPHSHDLRTIASHNSGVTQECWFVYRGKVSVQLFDENRTLIHEQTLSRGQLLITFAGGHSLQCIEANSMILEFKNGPYIGKDYQSFENNG